MSVEIIQEQIRPAGSLAIVNPAFPGPGCQCKQEGKTLPLSPEETLELQKSCSVGVTESEGDSGNCGDLLDFDNTLGTLLKMYSQHVNDDNSPPILVSSGGIQQFLNRKLPRSELEAQQPRKDAGSSAVTFHDLPDSLQLEIFSYLGPEDLCRVTPVCRHWFMLSSDDLLWQRRLWIDVRQWRLVGHSTNPDMYRDCQSDWSNKEIYLRCSPDVHRSLRQQNLGFHQLSSLLRSFWPKKTPRLAMFGPGLETSTSKIARKILEDTTGMFKATGMFPGQFEGVGSGFTMKMNNTTTFNLMTLYTSTKKERENWAQNERVQHNRLLAHGRRRSGDEERGEVEEEEEVYEVRQAIKDLCRTLDAFVFVVDASQDCAAVTAGRPELAAMLYTVWANPSIPLLVLSCIAEPETPRMPCIDVVRQLQLDQFNRPWQVHNCVVSSMEGAVEALDWVVQQTHRN